MCVEIALVSTMDSSRSAMVRAPIRRIFISNSSFSTIVRNSLRGQTLDRSFNSLLTIATHGIQEWSADTNTLRTKTNSFDNIRRSSHTTINIYFQLVLPSLLL